MQRYSESGSRRVVARCFLASLLFVLLTGKSSSAAGPKSTGVPRYDAAVAKAVAYLKSAEKDMQEKEVTLVAYALMKAGEPVTSSLVAKGIHLAKERGEGKKYQGYDHIYFAGVDAMLLADTDDDMYFPAIQSIADYVASQQQPNGGWSDGPKSASDTSMCQYGMLALWSAYRVGCEISPQVLEANARWHLGSGNTDGGWAYRPGTGSGTGVGSTHNMAMAGAGSLGIARVLLFGQKNAPKPEKKEESLKFGVLETVKPKEENTGAGFADFRPQLAAQQIDTRMDKAFGWINSRFPPGGAKNFQKQYFYYALERAASLHGLGKINGQDWFTLYGDVLLGLQDPDGSFPKTLTNPRIGSSFAILYFMRSTKQILDKQFGKGVMKGDRGNLAGLFGAKDKKKKELGPLDELLGGIMSSVEDLEKLDVSTEDIVEKVTFSSRDELVGQVDMLKKLLESKDAENRRTAYWALGRTGDFALIPLMMKGLRDPSVDCNVEALRSLRYISRKPNGFGLSLEPLAGAETADEERKVEVANKWRTKAYRTWGNWYRTVRPFDEGDGLDALELTSQRRTR